MTDITETTETIPWKLWIKTKCRGCGLTGEGRYRVQINQDQPCPQCGSTFETIGEPFPLEGSDQ